MMVPVITEDPRAPSAVPTADFWRWFTETGRDRPPSWKNEVTLRSVEMFMGFEPRSYLPTSAPHRCSCCPRSATT